MLKMLKRKKVLKKVNSDIAKILFRRLILQFEHRKLERVWVDQVYYSSFSSSGRCVALLLIHIKITI